MIKLELTDEQAEVIQHQCDGDLYMLDGSITSAQRDISDQRIHVNRETEKLKALEADLDYRLVRRRILTALIKQLEA